MGSMTVQQGQLDELDLLLNEAREARRFLVIEACERVSRCILARILPSRDDAQVVEQFIRQRQRQDRYGK